MIIKDYVQWIFVYNYKKALPLAGRKRAAARSAGQDLTLLS